MSVVLTVVLVGLVVVWCARWVVRTGQPIMRYLQHRQALRRRKPARRRSPGGFYLGDMPPHSTAVIPARLVADGRRCDHRAAPGETFTCPCGIIHTTSANLPGSDT